MKQLSIFLLFILTSCAAQPNLNSNNLSAKNQQNFEMNGSENPIKVRVTAVLLQRSDGSGNYSRSRPEEFKIFQTYWNNGLNNFKNLKKPSDLKGCYTGLDFWPDAKIIFEDRIIEVKNNYAWNNRNTGSNYEKRILKGFSPNKNWYLKALDDSLTLAEKDQPSIHIYFTNDGDTYDEDLRTKGKNYGKTNGVAAGQFPTSSDLSQSSQIHIPGVYPKYFYMKHQAPIETGKSWEEHTKNWYLIDDSKGITHELGHNFGLGHANEYHGTNTCKWTIMSQKHTDPRNYLQPTEIKKMHNNLSRTNLMQFVTSDSHYGTTQKISQNSTWDRPRRYYNNFELERNITLTITQKIIMPIQSTITLNRNSTLIFKDEGGIFYPDGNKFDGFVKRGNAKIVY